MSSVAEVVKISLKRNHPKRWGIFGDEQEKLEQDGFVCLYSYSSRGGGQARKVFVKSGPTNVRAFLYAAIGAYIPSAYAIPYWDGPRLVVKVEPGKAGRVIGGGGKFIKILSRCIGRRIAVEERAKPLSSPRVACEWLYHEANVGELPMPDDHDHVGLPWPTYL